MVAMLERVSMLCARVMRGMASRLKLVMRRWARICTRAGLRNGARKPISALPSGTALASSMETGRIFKGNPPFQQLRRIGHDARPRRLKLGVRDGGGRARAALDQDRMLLFEQQLDGVRDESHPCFLARFVEDANCISLIKHPKTL
jgi:hypothetical protein